MWEHSLQELEDKRNITLVGGGVEKIANQHNAGKLTARERIDLLMDSGTFIEINNFVESRINDFGLDKKRVLGDGVITGFGEIKGRKVFVTSEDFTVIGGTLGEYHSKKICEVIDMAIDTRKPIIMINDCGGARIEEGISSLSGYSSIFFRNTKASGVIPQIAVILGPCAGGASYSPAICDFVFMVENIGKMFITGPKVLKAVTNEETSAEDLGGAAVHENKSGVSHFTYKDERKCFDGVKKLLSYLPDSYQDNPQKISSNTKKSNTFFNRKTTNKCSDLTNIVSTDSRKSYDVHLVINDIIDDNSFFEVQSGFGMNAVVGFGHIDGYCIGIVANQPQVLAGALDINASDKIARFIRNCDCFNIPIITLIDVPGYFPGIEQEHGGIIRHGAKVIYAYSEATVTKISIIMRKAYGGAYIAMNSKQLGADLVYAWPIAEIAVMSAESAADVILNKNISGAENSEVMRDKFINDYNDKFINPYLAAARGLVAEVIRPDETRHRIIEGLKVLENKKVERVAKKHGNIPL